MWWLVGEVHCDGYTDVRMEVKVVVSVARNVYLNTCVRCHISLDISSGLGTISSVEFMLEINPRQSYHYQLYGRMFS